MTKPLAVVRHLDDADYLAQLEAVDRFAANMDAYPGRTFGQLYHRLLKGDDLVEGRFDLESRTLSLADVTAASRNEADYASDLGRERTVARNRNLDTLRIPAGCSGV